MEHLNGWQPVEVAEYTVGHSGSHDSGGASVQAVDQDVLRKRNRIISKLRSRYCKTAHKIGIWVPESVDDKLRIDLEHENDFWAAAIKKEMDKVKVAWRLYDTHGPDEVRIGKASDLIGYRDIKCHMIFDMEMDYTRKARFVAGGHSTDAPSLVTYSRVVSEASVRLAVLIAAHTNVHILACDVTNTSLNAQCCEEIFFLVC